jgi:hypothetical protein
LQAHKWFLFIHIDEEKKDIAHLWAWRWFFQLTHEKEKKWYYLFGGLRGFFYLHRWRKTMILHTCEPANGFLDSHMRRKEIICTLVTHKWFLLLNRWEKIIDQQKTHKENLETLKIHTKSLLWNWNENQVFIKNPI